MKLVVFGATGGTGGRVVEQALEAGHEVTAVVRNPARVWTVRHERLRVVEADVFEPAQIEPAAGGERRRDIGARLAPCGGQPGSAPPGTGSILEAMQKAGVRRFVCRQRSTRRRIRKTRTTSPCTGSWSGPCSRTIFRRVDMRTWRLMEEGGLAERRRIGRSSVPRGSRTSRARAVTVPPSASNVPGGNSISRRPRRRDPAPPRGSRCDPGDVRHRLLTGGD